MDLKEANPQEINDLIESIRAELAKRKARQGGRTTTAVSPRPTYLWGTDLTFHKDGNADAYLMSGWSKPEAVFRWTNGSLAEIELPVESVDSDLLLELDAYAFQKDAASRQTVRLRTNGAITAEWLMGGLGIHHALVLQSRIGKRKTLTLSFQLPDAISPAELGLGQDQRKLGIAVRRLTLRPLSS